MSAATDREAAAIEAELGQRMRAAELMRTAKTAYCTGANATAMENAAVEAELGQKQKAADKCRAVTMA